MKAMYRAALMVAASIFLLPLSAHSEIRAGSVEVTPFGGYNFFQSSQNLKDRPEFGGRLGYNFTRHFGVEGTVEFIRSRVDDKSIIGAAPGQFRSPVDKERLTFYHIDAVYHLVPDGKFNPFVVVGFGGVHYSPKISDKDMAAINVGIGAKYWLSDHVAFRADFRDYMVSELFEEGYHNFAATAGLTFAFGGKSKSAPAQIAKAEPKPEPKPVPVAKPEPFLEKKVIPKAEEPVIIVVLASEPKVEEKVKVLATEPKVEAPVIVLAFEDVHFEFDKSALSKEAKVILKRDIQVLKDNPKAQIRVAGYTSASGTEEYNQKLSERRADAVRKYLIDEGIVSPDRLTEIGYGEKRPAMFEAAPKDLYSPEAKANMRVLFEIIVK